MIYTEQYFAEAIEIINLINKKEVEAAVNIISNIRQRGGRLFFLGLGGSAANATHAVNDFRKIAGIECYTPLDNASELTAQINDNGWEQVFVEWLKISRLSANDAVFVFSVGGGSIENGISVNLVKALQFAKSKCVTVLGIVGRDGGYTAKIADSCIVIPTVNKDTLTPHTESFQALIWHLIVTHPKLKSSEMKWESLK
ncbi:MAG: SIS domain-containing protein [Dehalococcoidales bacterium]